MGSYLFVHKIGEWIEYKGKKVRIWGTAYFLNANDEKIYPYYKLCGEGEKAFFCWAGEIDKIKEDPPPGPDCPDGGPPPC